jgi:hypothetical protein
VDDHWTQLKGLAQPLLVENLKAGPKGGR